MLCAGLLAASVPTIAQPVTCRLDAPRSGIVATDVYVNDQNEAYLLLRFTDPRFDDTTEVYRLKDCKRIASGVTAKSNYAETFKANNFRSQTIPMGGSREFVNSLFGTLKVYVGPKEVVAELDAVSADRVAGLRLVQRLLRLQEAVPPARLTTIANDPMLSRLDDSEFNQPDSKQLPVDTLAGAFLAGTAVYRSCPSAWCKSVSPGGLGCAVLSAARQAGEWGQYR